MAKTENVTLAAARTAWGCAPVTESGELLFGHSRLAATAAHFTTRGHTPEQIRPALQELAQELPRPEMAHFAIEAGIEIGREDLAWWDEEPEDDED
jgi:hypothetical protein